MKTNLKSTQDLLVTKTNELASANAFLSATDDASIADACQELETLSNEIFQFAAQLSERLIFDRSVRASSFSDELGQLLGRPLCDLLLNVDAECLGLAVQVSIQTVFSIICNDVISSWCLFRPVFSNDLKTLYQIFHRQSPNRIAGTWRSLTRTHISQAAPFARVQSSLVERFTSTLAEVLDLAGWSKAPLDMRNTVLADCKLRITVICSAALKLNKMLGEQITSVDLETYHIRGGEAFDRSLMHDMFEENLGEKGCMVLGTTNLGIKQRERRGDEVIEVGLVQPKVVLLATFQN
ncbi:hypothetical protein DL96DRAFT_1749744 [Flagelloscypha sp. PMI_526]|nr:hypothetical protein DL96DRAFT_1749744 [Flagelloscypha sp. PMI_526]